MPAGVGPWPRDDIKRALASRDIDPGLGGEEGASGSRKTKALGLVGGLQWVLGDTGGASASSSVMVEFSRVPRRPVRRRIESGRGEYDELRLFLRPLGTVCWVQK